MQSRRIRHRRTFRSSAKFSTWRSTRERRERRVTKTASREVGIEGENSQLSIIRVSSDPFGFSRSTDHQGRPSNLGRPPRKAQRMYVRHSRMSECCMLRVWAAFLGVVCFSPYAGSASLLYISNSPSGDVCPTPLYKTSHFYSRILARKGRR